MWGLCEGVCRICVREYVGFVLGYMRGWFECVCGVCVRESVEFV